MRKYSKKLDNKVKQFREKRDFSYRRLSSILPLASPLSLIIDPTNICNFRCAFCPTADSRLLKSVGRPRGMMGFDLFQKIIDDARTFDKKIEKMYLYKDGEPFINKDLAKMIRYAKAKIAAKSIGTTSNASLITKKRAIEVIEAGLDTIIISIEHVNDRGYKNVVKTFSDYSKIRRNVEFLYNEKIKRKSTLKIHAKIVDYGLSPDDKEKFVRDFGSISDSVNICALMGWSNCDKKDFTLGKTVKTGIDGVSPLLRNRKVCPQPFKTMSVNFNGLVSVCCVDWSFGTLIGDVNKESLVDIWNGKAMRNFRILHLEGKRAQIQSCANCDYLEGINPMSDLDGSARELLEAYQRS